MKSLNVNRPELKAIYQRLGEERLELILRDFYERMSQDLLIGFFFDGKDLEKIASMQKHFLMRAMGAAPTYSGKAPADAHTELAPILSGHFDRRLRLLEETLRSHGLSETDIRAWVELEEAFRAGVVRSPGSTG